MKPIKPVILGCSGTTLTSAEKELFCRENPLGLILFDRNIRDPKQVRHLTSDFCACVNRPDAPVLIDQEGGHVQRLWPPYWTGLPYAATYGDWYKASPRKAQNAIKKHVAVLAKELLEIGINTDCWPLLDVRTPDTYEVMRKRCFSDDPEIVANLAQTAIEYCLHNGLTPIMKHIPGYGRATVNPHALLPTVSADLSTLRRTDFYPFKQIKIPVWGMIAHVRYTALDADFPATLSPSVIRYIRRNIGFKGPLITDDITMGALNTFGSPVDIACQSLAAGCDIVLYGQGTIQEITSLTEALPPLSASTQKRLKLTRKLICSEM